MGADQQKSISLSNLDMTISAMECEDGFSHSDTSQQPISPASD